MEDTADVKDRARYDVIADWYVGWVADSPGVLCDAGLVPDRLDGQRWLDVAAGSGRASRQLARRGAEVTGVDVSADLIRFARAEEERHPLGIRHVVAESASSEWWNDRAFDGAVCEMALMDIDELPGTLAAISRVLRPGGPLLVSMVHPCFPGNDAGLSSWPPSGSYFDEGRWVIRRP